MFPRGPYEPVALFFDQEFLRSLRWNALRPRDAADGVVNEPAFHIAEKRLRTMTPRNPSEDPFILAALVAMAQEAVRRKGISEQALLMGNRYTNFKHAVRTPTYSKRISILGQEC